MDTGSTPSAREAYRRLCEGNARYRQNVVSVDALYSHRLRDDLLSKPQRPIAIILGCSDARAPAEMVFDQGLGDLFVIRIAGNIVAPSQVGSVEFAAGKFGTRLVVVMGHTRCGAIEATIDAIAGRAPGSENLSSIVDLVRPSIERLDLATLAADPQKLRREAVRANVRASVAALQRGSRIIERLVAEEGLAILGAELDLATGEVAFFDGGLE